MKSVKYPATVWRNPVHFIAFGFGVGTIGIAPGTFGTVVAIPIYLLMQDLAPVFYITGVAVLFLAGIWICEVTSRDLGVDDHPGIVIDEITGFLLAMTASPSGWLWIVCGFLLFRLFDIWKPWPIGMIDRRVRGGMGIMADDIVAGIFTFLVLQIMIYAFLDKTVIAGL